MVDGVIDEDERKTIRSALHEGLFVEAGAGTGKTSELVARMVGLISGGYAQISEIVAITFTEAAAAELCERVRARLESTRDDVNVSSIERDRCMNALLMIDDAPVQTIHAFAQRVLQAHALDAGLPHVFGVQDRVESRLAFNRRWHEFVHRTMNTDDELDPELRRLLETGMALGMRTRHLKLLAQQLSAQWHRAQRSLDAPEAHEWSIDLQPILKLIDGVMEMLPLCSIETDSAARLLTERVDPWRRRLRFAHASGAPLAMLDALSNGPELKTRGNKGNWRRGALEEVRKGLAVISDERASLLYGPRQWVIDGVMRLLARFVLAGVEERKSNGTLEFHDLLVYAAQLVKNDEVRRQLQMTYRYFLVDEFQDTDPLQTELIRSLAGERADRAGQAGSNDVSHLFTVGDPKQSIYRFRHADPKQYFATREQMSARLVRLRSNFRSLPAIVSWVNTSFENMLSTDLTSDWTPLHAGRNALDSVGSITVIDEMMDCLAGDVRERESDELVAIMADAKAKCWCVHDASGSDTRPIDYRDMAVLVPSRRSLPALERALRRADVPYRIESRSLVWATQEIRDALSILRAIQDPTDQIALVASLRSPAFACGDDDLMHWKEAGGAWNYCQPWPESMSHSPVARALETLKSFHDRRWWLSVPELLSDIVRDRQVFELAFARARQRESWARIRFLIDQARAWTERGGAGLHDFLDWATTQQDEEADALETVVPETDDDAVRVMTIHAAKGLEFPFVGLIGLGTSGSITESARLLWNDAGDPEVRIGPQTEHWETPGFESVALAEREADRDEQARALYVGATRARDHLVASLYRTKRSGSSTLAARLSEACANATVVEPLLRDQESISTQGDVATAADVESRFAEIQERRDQAIRFASKPAALSATAVAAKVSGVDDVLPVQVSGHQTQLRDTDWDLATRLAFGSAVHNTLERVDPGMDDEEIRTVSFAMATENDVAQHAESVVKSVKLALASDLLHEASSSGGVWREIFVSSAVDDLVIGGTVDLLFERDDGLVVVDYKTELLQDVTAEARALSRYRWQLLTYATALQQTLMRDVVEATLLFIAPSQSSATAVSIPNLSEAMGEYRDRVGALAAGPAAPA